MLHLFIIAHDYMSSHRWCEHAAVRSIQPV